MNLTQEKWIMAIRSNGVREKIAPHQIADPSILDLTAFRPDFKGAQMQYLIGLLQTTCPPDTVYDWEDWWNVPPEPGDLKELFNEMADAFEFNREGPSFMQDYDLPDGEYKSISALLIESPGGKTLKDNLDHFIKRGQVKAVCPHCSATALFTLQTNAPSGGVGHRVGLRGGGPLTTQVLPDESEKKSDTLATVVAEYPSQR